MDENKPDKENLLKELPSVDEIIKSTQGNRWRETYPRSCIIKAIREVIDKKREAIMAGKSPDLSSDCLYREIEPSIKLSVSKRLIPVINATGIVIHTNLGRAPLSDEAIENISRIARGYSNLEYNIGKGKRGKRYDNLRWIIRDLTGAEDAIVVNNNAAAVLLSLSALAGKGEVVISRGELVEIGGSFRIPDVMKLSGSVLREVGTTNKTHPGDYEEAINENTALLLKVHQSNYRMIGFTDDVPAEEIVEIGKRHGIPVMFDLGSGCLVDLGPLGIHGEPVVGDIVKSGVDIVTFSGDKLLGGPQAGIIAGRRPIIEKIGRHPLTRAVRVDKLTLSALEATLIHYLDTEKAGSRIPVLKAIFQDEGVLKKRATRLLKGLSKQGMRDIEISLEKDYSQAGGGSLPGVDLPTYVVTVKSGTLSSSLIEERLRRGTPSVIARVKEGRLLLDIRTINDSELHSLISAVKVTLSNQ